MFDFYLTCEPSQFATERLLNEKDSGWDKKYAWFYLKYVILAYQGVRDISYHHHCLIYLITLKWDSALSFKFTVSWMLSVLSRTLLWLTQICLWIFDLFNNFVVWIRWRSSYETWKFVMGTWTKKSHNASNKFIFIAYSESNSNELTVLISIYLHMTEISRSLGNERQTVLFYFHSSYNNLHW